MRVSAGAGPGHCKRSEIWYPQCLCDVDTTHRTWALNKHIRAFTRVPGGLQEVVEPAAELMARMRLKFS
jgi:hypothetical protein